MRSKRAPDRDFGAVGRLRRTGAGKRLSCALVAVVALVTLGLGIRQDLQVNAGLLTPATMSSTTLAYAQEMCLFHALRRELPKGATFYDGDTDVNHFQRLAELATLWAVPEQNPAAAQWRVAIVPGHCARIGLKAWRA
jgi:hypothetical protein